MTKRINVIFVDDLYQNTTMEKLLDGLRKDGRFLKICGRDTFKEQDDLQVLRPIMAMKDWLSTSESLVHEERPGYDQYLYVIFNGSPYSRLLHTKDEDRVSGAMYVNRIHSSYKIKSEHFVIAGSEHTERVLFTHRAAGKDVYRIIDSVEELAKAFDFNATSNLTYHCIEILNERNLTKI